MSKDDTEARAQLRDDAPQLIGQSAGGSHIYYDEFERTMFEGPAPDEEPTDERVNEEPVADDGVAGIVDTVHEREGWEWLSEFADEHVPGAGGGDDETESGRSN